MANGTLANLATSAFVRTPPTLSKRNVHTLYQLPAMGQVNVLDPAAGEGDLLVPFDVPQCHCYGIEISAERARVARSKVPLADIIISAFENVRFPTPACMSIVRVNPPYLLVNGKRAEYRFVANATDLLAPGGILEAIIPARSAWDGTMINFLCRWYDHIRVWKFPDASTEEESPFERFTQIVVVGVKRAEPVETVDKSLHKRLMGYRWRKDKNGYEGWDGMAPPELPTEPLPQPYQIPAVNSTPIIEVRNASDAVLLEALETSGAHLSRDWAMATIWEEEERQLERPITPYTGAAHVAAEVLTNVLGGEVVTRPNDDHAYLFTAFVSSEWSKLDVDADTGLQLRKQGVISATARQLSDHPVLGVLDLATGSYRYYEGEQVFAFLQPWLASMASYALARRPPLYNLEPAAWELEVLAHVGRDKQLPGATFPGLAPAQIHRVCAMRTALDVRGRVAIQGEPGTGKTRQAIATVALMAYRWQHRTTLFHNQKQPEWIRGLRQAWLKNARTRALLRIEPVYGYRERTTVSGEAHIREDASSGQIVAYRHRDTGKLLLPEEAGPRAYPALVATPKRVTKEYEREVQAAWPEAETMLIEKYSDIQRWMQRCAVSQAPAVVAIISHSLKLPFGHGWIPAVEERVMVRGKPFLRKSQLEEVTDENGWRRYRPRVPHANTELSQDGIINNTRFRCPDCYGIVRAIPREGFTEKSEAFSLKEKQVDEEEAEEERQQALRPVNKFSWFERKPRQCSCESGPHFHARRIRGLKPLQSPLWMRARLKEVEGGDKRLPFAIWSQAIRLLCEEAQAKGGSLKGVIEVLRFRSRSTKAQTRCSPTTQALPSYRLAATDALSKTEAHQSTRLEDFTLVPHPDDRFSPYEFVFKFYRKCVGLAVIDESHNGRAENTDIGRAHHQVMLASQCRMLTSGTHFGGDILSFFFYWFRFNPSFWIKLGLNWHQASEALRRYGVVQEWTKTYESDARKGSGQTDVRVSTIPAPGISAKIIPYLLVDLVFLTVLDVGAFMPPRIEIPQLVSMEDPEVKAKKEEAQAIRRAIQAKKADLEKEKAAMMARLSDESVVADQAQYEAERAKMAEFLQREKQNYQMIELQDTQAARLEGWVYERDLLGAYITLSKELSDLAQKRNNAARMAQGTLPRWFATMPCDKPFELIQAERDDWGEHIGSHLLARSRSLTWNHVYPLERDVQQVVRQELDEGRRVLIYIEQNKERPMSKRLTWVLAQVGITSWSLPDKVDAADRQAAIISAMSGDNAVQVAIVQAAKVSEGINLQSVIDTIVWFELANDPFLSDQASRRAWRLGKREEVRIYYQAYVGTVAHSKMRKLGSQNGASAAFAGEPARGALIEHAGADRSTLARFSATVESAFDLENNTLSDEEDGLFEEVNEEALLTSQSGDAEALRAAFARRAKEEQEALHKGRQWLGATDHLEERLPAFFAAPNQTLWLATRAATRVLVVDLADLQPDEVEHGRESDSVVDATAEVVQAEPIPSHLSVEASGALVNETVSDQTSPAPSLPEHAQESQVNQVPMKSNKKEVRQDKRAPRSTKPVQRQQKHVQHTSQLAKKTPQQSVPETPEILLFGNDEHIALVRPRKRRKPAVEVTVTFIPAVGDEKKARGRGSERSKGGPAQTSLWTFLNEATQTASRNATWEAPITNSIDQLSLW